MVWSERWCWFVFGVYYWPQVWWVILVIRWWIWRYTPGCGCRWWLARPAMHGVRIISLFVRFNCSCCFDLLIHRYNIPSRVFLNLLVWFLLVLAASYLPPSPISGHCKHCYNSSRCHQCCPRNVLLGGQYHRKLLILPRQSLGQLSVSLCCCYRILLSCVYILRPSIVHYKDCINSNNVILIPFSCCYIVSFTRFVSIAVVC